MPREVIEIEHLPLLGTGKTDYAAVTRLAEAATGGFIREV